MKIAEILEIASKRTQGIWELKALMYDYRLVTRVGGENRYIAHLVKQKEDADYFLNAPEMESKLRLLSELLPEIKNALAFIVHGCGMSKDEAKDLLTKLEEWENE